MCAKKDSYGFPDILIWCFSWLNSGLDTREDRANANSRQSLFEHVELGPFAEMIISHASVYDGEGI
jgi:hypothetical protein